MRDYRDYDDEETLYNPYSRDDDFDDAYAGADGFGAGTMPPRRQRVRKWVDDADEPAPYWTLRRVLVIVVALLLIASLLLWDILPLLDVAIMPDAVTRPTPTAMPGA